jgi:hypothetical protein
MPTVALSVPPAITRHGAGIHAIHEQIDDGALNVVSDDVSSMGSAVVVTPWMRTDYQPNTHLLVARPDHVVCIETAAVIPPSPPSLLTCIPAI